MSKNAKRKIHFSGIKVKIITITELKLKMKKKKTIVFVSFIQSLFNMENNTILPLKVLSFKLPWSLKVALKTGYFRMI